MKALQLGLAENFLDGGKANISQLSYIQSERRQNQGMVLYGNVQERGSMVGELSVSLKEFET